jgi:hypothetical protein
VACFALRALPGVCGIIMMAVQGRLFRLRESKRRRYGGLFVLSLGVLLAGCAQQQTAQSEPTAAAPAPETPPEASTLPAPLASVSPQAVAEAAHPSSSIGVTAVGQKAAQFRSDFEKLKTNSETRSAQLEEIRSKTVHNVEIYNALVGGISARLQMGSTPGNPELLAQWNQAQGALTQIDNDIGTLNTLSAQVSADAAASAYLLDSIRAAFSLSGAVEEDHRQLRILEDEVTENAIIIDRALQGLNDEINRQSQYVTQERTSLVQLAQEINQGQSYSGVARRAVAAPAAVAMIPDFAQRKPLVVIRFDKPDVPYESALYQALSRALERRPDAVFDLVAVSPTGGNAATAKQKADAVLKSMTGMGLPSDRVAETSMDSPSAKTPEVHIYVR